MLSIIFKPLTLFFYPISLLESSPSYLHITHSLSRSSTLQPKTVVLLSILPDCSSPRAPHCCETAHTQVSAYRSLPRWPHLEEPSWFTLPRPCFCSFSALLYTNLVTCLLSLQLECEFYENKHSVSYSLLYLSYLGICPEHNSCSINMC